MAMFFLTDNTSQKNKIIKEDKTSIIWKLESKQVEGRMIDENKQFMCVIFMCVTFR